MVHIGAETCLTQKPKSGSSGCVETSAPPPYLLINQPTVSSDHYGTVLELLVSEHSRIRFQFLCVEFAGEVLFSLWCDVVDAVAEVDEEAVGDKFFAALVDVLARESDSVAVCHLFWCVWTLLVEMFEYSIVSS